MLLLIIWHKKTETEKIKNRKIEKNFAQFFRFENF